LITDAAGNFYGTTAIGGKNGGGTVFKLAPDGTETVLYSFCTDCADGRYPASGLFRDSAGNLYGTAVYGGVTNKVFIDGAGTVFKLAPDGTETALHTFCSQSNCTDGANPFSNLISDSAGNLYGTTNGGGQNGRGVVFRIAPDGTETVLYSFCSQYKCADGAAPFGGLIFDNAGNLYGTTYQGGHSSCYPRRHSGCGTVFKLAPDGTETVLYAFCHKYKAGCPDGANPVAGLIADNAGNLYGTTVTGTDSLFKLAPDGTLTVLHAFCSLANCADGSGSRGALIADGAGNLYGTTHDGGVNSGGTVFELAPSGTFTVLHSFAYCSDLPCSDGDEPAAPLLMDGAGAIYGTTEYGGKGDWGLIFKLVPRQ